MGGALDWIAGLLPGARTARKLRKLSRQLDHVEHLVRKIDHLSLGTSATYIGDNRMLLRILAGHHLFMLYLHADDKLITPSFVVNGRYEPELTDYFASALKLDSHCIDVGANLGYFTCFMAKHCPQGRVIGLEPNPPIYTLAVDNVLLNALGSNASILNVAASDAAGELTLYHRIGRAGNTSMAAVGRISPALFGSHPRKRFRSQPSRSIRYAIEWAVGLIS